MLRFILISFCCYFCLTIGAQPLYVSALEFPIFGRISNNTTSPYDRLPVELQKIARADIWHLGENSAGMFIRFCSNATKLWLKWQVKNNLSMAHMTDLGIKGLDLYKWDGVKWKYVDSALPTGKNTETSIPIGISMIYQEFMLYLPLYDGVDFLQMGVDSSSIIKKPTTKHPHSENPIIVYGTSITQGGCASRPGMAWTSIVSRKLNKVVVNLGFSGNARLDYDIAELMAASNASLYILDFMPNVNAQMVKEKLPNFLHIIQKKRGNIPIIILQHPRLPKNLVDKNTYIDVEEKSKALIDVVDSLMLSGIKKLYIEDTLSFLGDDDEATVDGIHFTDLGFSRYATQVESLIKKHIK